MTPDRISELEAENKRLREALAKWPAKPYVESSATMVAISVFGIEAKEKANNILSRIAALQGEKK